MNKKKYLWIIGILLVFIFLVGIDFVLKDIWQKDIQEDDPNEFIKTQQNGERENISEKIKNAKFEIEGLEFTNIKLSELAGKTNLTVDVYNGNSESKGDIELRNILLDKNGNVILEMGSYIGNIEPGQTFQISSSATLDYANAYDILIEKK